MVVSQEVIRFLRWTGGVTRKFFIATPWDTSFVIIASVTKGILSLLAFMVPIKVIMLAASPGVPRYFPFVNPADKSLWIVLLAIGAVGIYVLIQLLSPIIDRWSLRAGKELLRGANDLPVHSRDTSQAQRVFSAFTGISASLLFLLATSLILLWVNAPMLAWLIVSTGVLYIVSSALLAGESLPRPPQKNWVIERYRSYIGTWEALTFFGSFAVILWPFLQSSGGGGNVFLALISFILVRRMISELGGIIKKAVSLVQQRPMFDALLYRHHTKVRLTDESKSLLFRELFALDSRNRLFAEMISHDLGKETSIASRWVDPTPPQIKHFLIEATSTDDKMVRQHLEARVHGPDTNFQFEHAEFLFLHIPRRLLRAPEFYGRIDHHEFKISLQLSGTGQQPPASQWRDVFPILAQDILSLAPPKALVRSYRDTHPMLGDRLTDKFCRRIEVALDSEADTELFAAWLSSLPQIQNFLQSQPVALINPDLTLSNVVCDGSAGWLIMYWGRWRLEPVGAAVLLQGIAGQAASITESLGLKRPDLKSAQWANDLEIAALCLQIEQAINSDRAKQALTLIGKTLEQFQVHSSRKVYVTRNQPHELESITR